MSKQKTAERHNCVLFVSSRRKICLIVGSRSVFLAADIFSTVTLKLERKKKRKVRRMGGWLLGWVDCDKLRDVNTLEWIKEADGLVDERLKISKEAKSGHYLFKEKDSVITFKECLGAV